MPKVSSDRAKFIELVKSTIKGNQGRYSVSGVMLARYLGINQSTLSRKINREPELINLGELQGMAKKLKFTDEQILMLVRGKI